MRINLKQGEKAYMNLNIEVKSIDKEEFTLDAIFSTKDVDRHGDVVIQDGWDLANFKRNPVILNSHNYGDATEVIGRAFDVRVENGKLQGKIKFAVAENPKAKIIFDLYANKFLSAFSVGFIPTKFKTNKDGSTDWSVIEEAELLEVSAVSVPANARALAKEKGIDIDSLNTKQNDDQNIKEDGTTDGEGADTEPNKIQENSGDEANHGEPTPGDNNGGESEPNGKDGAGDGDIGNDGGDGKIPGADSVKVDENIVENIVENVDNSKNYKAKVANAIKKMNDENHEYLKKVATIINSLLENDVDSVRLEEKVKSQIKQRKVHQAIRTLLKIK